MDSLRPSHYKAGQDTFAWAEANYTTEECLAMVDFNIHKYFNRNKGQDYADYGKIADYALWARKLMDKQEVKEAKHDDAVDAVASIIPHAQRGPDAYVQQAKPTGEEATVTFSEKAIDLTSMIEDPALRKKVEAFANDFDREFERRRKYLERGTNG